MQAGLSGLQFRTSRCTERKIMKFDAVYYEPDSLNYELGRELKEKYAGLPWFPIASHNSIKEMQEKPNSEFGKM